jgi:hypothetical protein
MTTQPGLSTPTPVDWSRRAFELAAELGHVAPAVDAGDYCAALAAAGRLADALPLFLAELVDEAHAGGVTWQQIADALDRHRDVIRRTYSPARRLSLGGNGPRPGILARRAAAAAAGAGDNSRRLDDVA